ncbi:hypothetical protein HKD37_08G023113 [Glycine soja]
MWDEISQKITHPIIAPSQARLIVMFLSTRLPKKKSTIEDVTWDILAITYEGSKQVKCNKPDLLTRKYKLFTIEEDEDIQSMFGHFQTILNELQSLVKNLDSMSMEELVRTLKTKKSSTSTSRLIHNNALNAILSFDDEFDKESNKDDQLAFISIKIWRKKGKSNWKGSSKKPSRDSMDKEKKLHHLLRVQESRTLQILKDQVLSITLFNPLSSVFKSKNKKMLISVWVDLDNTLSYEETQEEANFCLMADTTSEESVLDSNEEFLNDKLEKNDNLKGQPQDVMKF